MWWVIGLIAGLTLIALARPRRDFYLVEQRTIYTQEGGVERLLDSPYALLADELKKGDRYLGGRKVFRKSDHSDIGRRRLTVFTDARGAELHFDLVEGWLHSPQGFPGRIFLWKVTARGAAGAELAVNRRGAICLKEGRISNVWREIDEMREDET